MRIIIDIKVSINDCNKKIFAGQIAGFFMDFNTIIQ